MKSYNLDFYVKKLKKGEHFSLIRYGDGEFLCMWGSQGQNCDGTRYTKELAQGLVDAFKHFEDPTFFFGMQRVLPQDRARAEKEYPQIDWVDSEVFADTLQAGELFPLFQQLRKMKVVFIGKEAMRKITEIIPGEYIAVSASNAILDAEMVKEKIIATEPGKVFVFSAGMASNVIISELHGKVDGWLLDLGHIFDPFIGILPRTYLTEMTKEQIDKNLCRNKHPK